MPKVPAGHPVTVAEDRSLLIPPGHVVRTAWVPCHRIRLASTARMAVGDVERAYHRRIQTRPNQLWPPPVGRWEDNLTFLLLDGRHEYIAALMVGDRGLLVAWTEKAADA